MDTTSLSIEETNKIRAQLGLKPLSVEDNNTKSAQISDGGNQQTSRALQKAVGPQFKQALDLKQHDILTFEDSMVLDDSAGDVLQNADLVQTTIASDNSKYKQQVKRDYDIEYGNTLPVKLDDTRSFESLENRYEAKPFDPGRDYKQKKLKRLHYSAQKKSQMESEIQIMDIQKPSEAFVFSQVSEFARSILVPDEDQPDDMFAPTEEPNEKYMEPQSQFVKEVEMTVSAEPEEPAKQKAAMPKINKGLGSTLALLLDKGIIQTEKAQEDTVKVEYRDEFGRILDAKEQWKVLSRSYFGRSGGKNATDKRLSRIKKELEEKRARLKVSVAPQQDTEKSEEVPVQLARTEQTQSETDIEVEVLKNPVDAVEALNAPANSVQQPQTVQNQFREPPMKREKIKFGFKPIT